MVSGAPPDSPREEALITWPGSSWESTAMTLALGLASISSAMQRPFKASRSPAEREDLALALLTDVKSR